MPLEKKVLRDVLIVEDDHNICELLKLYCKNMGCFNKIVFANDGISASLKLSNQKFSLILLDLSLPKKNGLQVLQEMDSNNCKSTVCVISGMLEKSSVEKLVSLGVKYFLSKPFDEASFQSKILRILA